MKSKLILITMMSLCFAVLTISAQEKMTNFAGSWKLDSSVSNFGERDRIESITMKISQTDKELKVDSDIKRGQLPENVMRRGGGMGRSGMVNGGDENQTVVYNLDGKETKVKTNAGMISGERRFKAKREKEGKLALTQILSFGNQENAREFKVTETWELQNDGKTLKIIRLTESPRGSQTSELYFTKEEK